MKLPIKTGLFLVFLFNVSLCSFANGEMSSQLSDEAIPLQIASFPERPKPLLEIGDPFLNVGQISQGTTLPTGAVWQPSLMVFGTYRTAFQSFSNGVDQTTEWANRFDLYSNLYLTQTERILAGVRFLDKKGKFSGYTFSAPESVKENGKGKDDATNLIVRTLFFEGDLGEIFPNLDPEDKHGLDIGFSIGRQPLSFQSGMLIDDNIDAIGVTKTNLQFKGFVNMRTTFVYGNNEINRKNLAIDDSQSSLYGLFNEIDFRSTTVEFDAIYVEGSEITKDGVFGGLGFTQRLGDFNTTFRILGSHAPNDQTDHNSNGLLLFGEISWTPKKNHNHVYINAFRGFENFRSASRDPTAGGPLGRTGILFEAVGLGRYPSPLDNEADEAYGGVIGYQMFFDEKRKQWTFELGGRYSTEKSGQRAGGSALGYQMALGQREVLKLAGYALYDESRDMGVDFDQNYRFGLRCEWEHNF